ncbi:nucleoside recognition domain-containing protein [Bacillus alveayuensis]|jgi:spore maturation protein A|uniref:nucleoside recognition domain-containing protein n=1 Tax=Aeribacillus alveayuensis TaxID=279215 RepID=UPI0005CC958B|nr:nucleoside recognition domain-containing protein [Bacillus alveayuensis]
MVNIIWMMMAIVGIMFAAVNGTIEEVNAAIFKGAKEAVTISIGMISILVFWLGLMKIAEEAGLLNALGTLAKPIVKRLFPEVPPNHPAMGYIVSNMIANMFGLGNAATPMGIKAMEELNKLNGNKDVASRSMVTFLAINTSSITLIPATVISIRMTYGSAAPGEIIGTTLVASALGTIGAIFIDRYYYWKRTRRGGRRP